MLDKNFIRRKINLIQTELEYLNNVKDLSFDEISKDFVRQATVERVLERVINRAIDINQHLIVNLHKTKATAPINYRQTFILLSKLNIYSAEFAEQISKSVGTRNMLIHEYDKVDGYSVYHSIKDCLNDYYKYCEYILDFLDKG